MEVSVHYFVKAQAKASLFFDFDESNGKLTSHINGSQRACLVRSQHHCPSSSQLWLSYNNSPHKIESFKTIRTLLNFNEGIIDINVEWFSKMRNLSVVHLGTSFSEYKHLDVVDLKFLEELNNMTQLRLLSLEAFTAIMKLPDSICKLTNLRMLNLRYCCNLEEIPSGIGSLAKLTHLDLTYCHLLSRLPKEIRLLSKLEVIKGFMINYEVGGPQHKKACVLRDLLKLDNLRKISIVVNKDTFPDNNDIRVFEEMNNLCNLKITWKHNCYKDEESQVAMTKEALRQSRWKQLKCWGKQTLEDDAADPLKRNRLCNLRKLVLHCFPSETAPSWLHPSELQQLEKLYIIGGNLKTLPGDTNQNTWKVKHLHLKYLSNMAKDWNIVAPMFPELTTYKPE